MFCGVALYSMQEAFNLWHQRLKQIKSKCVTVKELEEQMDLGLQVRHFFLRRIQTAINEVVFFTNQLVQRGTNLFQQLLR